jgi:hypothetical protein
MLGSRKNSKPRVREMLVNRAESHLSGHALLGILSSACSRNNSLALTNYDLIASQVEMGTWEKVANTHSELPPVPTGHSGTLLG